MSGISKSRSLLRLGPAKAKVGRLCSEIDGRIWAFTERPIEGDWPQVRLHATYLKAGRDGRVGGRDLLD